MGREIGQSFSPPAGAIEIAFPRSDGNSRRPDRPNVVPGEINNFRQVGHSEPANVRWRVEVATRMAKHVASLDSNKNYIFTSWPEGYALFDHEKGATKESARHDLYLYGSEIVLRFRSVNEFVPHALWLYSQSSDEPCGCRYCSKAKGQSEVSHHFNLPVHARVPDNPPILIRRPTLPFTVPAPEQRVNPQRDADLRATARSARKFRVGEIVWCIIDPPIVGVKKIDWWPAIVREVRLKSVLSNRKRCTISSSARSEYSVEQSHTYKVQLLGVRHFIVAPESMMLPYLAWFPSIELFNYMKSLERSYDGELSSDLHEVSSFYPMPSDSYLVAEQPTSVLDDQNFSRPPPTQGRFEDAIVPYALGVQISAYISKTWTLTDEWEFKPRVSKQLLHQRLDNGAASSSTGAVAVAASVATDDVKSMNKVGEYRYQGLWWGCERIWQDDLVRLQPYRDQLEHDDLLPPSDTANTRSVFLLLSAIFISQTEKENVGKIAGPLFELAPEGWVDQERSPLKAGAVARRQDTEQPLSAPPPLQQSETPQGSTQTSYPLPPPPQGFVFRQITPPGHEAVLSIKTLAGRYYSGLFDTQPGLQRIKELGIESVVADDPTGPLADDLEPVLALCGLAPSFRGIMQSDEWKKSRLEQFTSADLIARTDIYHHNVRTKSEAKGIKAEEEDPLLLLPVNLTAGLHPDDPMIID